MVARYDVYLCHDNSEGASGRRNHERVAHVNAALQAAGLVTWFDEERMRGDVVAQMTDGIERSSVVLVFVTQNYIRKVAGVGPNGANDNCKAEFDYACNRKGVERLLPVVMESECSDPRAWHGAVGMRLGSQLYVDMSDDAKLAECVHDIVTRFHRMESHRADTNSVGATSRRTLLLPVSSLRASLSRLASLGSTRLRGMASVRSHRSVKGVSVTDRASDLELSDTPRLSNHRL